MDPANPVPELQFSINVGSIGRDNEINAWADYQKLIRVCARRASADMPAGEVVHATEYFLFGCRDGRSYTKHLSEAEANKLMIEAFITGMKQMHTSILDPDPSPFK